jgi:AcrR family transcriptional regulator
MAAVRAAGVRMLYERGYHAMSMRDLAAAVGLQAASLYNHWATKQELLVDLLTSNLQHLVAGADRALAGVEGYPERLNAFVAYHLTYQTTHPRQAQICTTELRSLEPAHYARVVGLRRRQERLLIEILEGGAAAGVFSIGDVRVAAYAILGMLNAAAIWYRPRGRLSRAALIAEYQRLVMAGVAKTNER